MSAERSDQSLSDGKFVAGLPDQGIQNSTSKNASLFDKNMPDEKPTKLLVSTKENMKRMERQRY